MTVVSTRMGPGNPGNPGSELRARDCRIFDYMACEVRAIPALFNSMSVIARTAGLATGTRNLEYNQIVSFM